MRKPLAAALTAAVLAAVIPAASYALVSSSATHARFEPRLAEQLDAADVTEDLVVMVHGTARDAAVAAVNRAGLRQVAVLESIGVPVAVGSPAQVASLRDAPGVTYVEADAPIRLLSDTANRATRTSESRKTYVDAKGKPLYTGAGHSIAIVDGGIDGTHPMFQRNGKSKVVRNMKVACVVCDPGASSDSTMIEFTGSTNDTDTISAGGHGTHVASIAAGVRRVTGGRVVTGTAPGADLVGISVGESLSIIGADIALDWIARNHANPCADVHRTCNPITVVNNSYGSDGGPFDPESATAKISKRLVGAGVVMVWANGNGDSTNDGGDGSDNRSNPEAQNPLPGVLAVANYDDGDSGTRDGSLDSSSSRGDARVPATWPDVSAPGTNITAACRPYLSICGGATNIGDPNYGTISGTSMASPHVAGIVAVLQQAKPGITPAQIEDVLEDTAHRFTAGGPYTADPSNATTPSSFDKGHGLVDTMQAIQAVLTGNPVSTAAACSGLSGTDPKGEPQPFAVNLVSGPYDPAIDLTSVAMTSDATKETLTLRLAVADLSDNPPSGGDGIYAEATFDAGGPHVIDVSRDANGTAAVSIDGVHTKLAAAFDAKADTITVTVPRKSFEPDLAGAVAVGGVKVQIGRTTVKLVLWSDSAATGCGTIDVGGVAAPPKAPDGTATPGSPYTWKGDPTTVVSDPIGAGVTVGVTGTVEDERLVNVPVGGKLVVNVSPDVALDDFDIELFGPDGAPVGFGSDDPSSADGNSASAPPGGETITVPGAAPGVYRVVVHAFTTVESSYTGTVTVK